MNKKIYKTKYCQLDKAMGGLKAGEITVLASADACGFCPTDVLPLNIISYMSQRTTQNINVLIFSVEHILEFKNINSKSNIFGFGGKVQIMKQKYVFSKKDTYKEKGEYIDELVHINSNNANIYIDYRANDIDSIDAKSRLVNFDLIIISAINLNVNNSDSDIARIKKLAQELNIPIILTTQMKRYYHEKESCIPMVCDVRLSLENNVDKIDKFLILTYNNAIKEVPQGSMSYIHCSPNPNAIIQKIDCYVLSNTDEILAKILFDYDQHNLVFAENSKVES